MINVNGVHPATPPKALGQVGPADSVAPNAETVRSADVVEISQIAKLAAQIHELPEVRTELVQQVKEEIASGKYETPERLDVAIDKLMDELFPGT